MNAFRLSALLLVLSLGAAAAPVLFQGKVLFEVRTNRAGNTPEERAQLATDRLERAARNPLLRPDSIRVAEVDGRLDILAGDQFIAAVTEADARAENQTRDELAAAHARSIREAIRQYRETWSARRLAAGAAWAALLTLLLAAAVAGVARLARAAEGRLARWKSLRIQQAEILSTARLPRLYGALLTWASAALYLVLAAAYLTTVFGLFPFTEDWAAAILRMLGQALQALGSGIAAALPDLAFVVIVAVFTYYLLRAVKFFFIQLRKQSIVLRGFHQEWAVPTYKLVRLLVIAIAGVAVFPYLPGAKSPAFQGISVFLGVLISFGSSSAVANAIAGVILIYMRSLRLGDFVRVGDQEGFVVESSLLVTRLRTTKNLMVTIPNSVILNSHVSNFTSLAEDRGLILHTTITIGYDAPWRKVHELLIAAARATPGILSEPQPFVFQTALNDFNVSYQINAYTGQPDRIYEMYTALHQHIQDQFNAAGVEIMSPNYHAVRDGNTVTIPAAERPDGYRAPGFRVQSGPA